MYLTTFTYIPVGVTTVTVVSVVIIDVDIIVGTKLDVIAKLDKVEGSKPAKN